MRTANLYSTFSLLAVFALAAGSAAAADSDGDTIDDTADQFPCDASLSTTVYVPSEGAFGSVLYEDNWPALGDLDFNDGVVAYQYALGYEGPPANNNLTMLTLSFNVLAAGAGLPSGLALSLPIPKANIQSVTLQTAGGAPQSLTVRSADTNAVIDLLDNTKDNFDNLGPFVNTEPSIPAQAETQYKLTVSLSSAVQVNPAEAPFDLFFFHTDDPSREIHRPMYEGTAGMNQALFNTEADGSTASRHFVDKDGLPFVLDIPKVPQWAQEQVSVDMAYPQVVGFAASGGSQNQTWYDAPVAQRLFAVGAGGGTMPIASFIPGENGYLPGWADDSCFSCSDGVQNGYEEGVDCGGNCPNSCVSLCTGGSMLFTSNGTFTLPAGCAGPVRVVAIGGGGVGGVYPGSGGGSGYLRRGTYSPLGPVTVTVGAQQQSSSFGTFLTAEPGGNGVGGDNATGALGGSSGGGKYNGYWGGGGGSNGSRGGERSNEVGNGAASQGIWDLTGITRAALVPGAGGTNNIEGGGGGGGLVVDGCNVNACNSQNTGYGGKGYGSGGGGGNASCGAPGAVYVEWDN